MQGRRRFFSKIPKHGQICEPISGRQREERERKKCLETSFSRFNEGYDGSPSELIRIFVSMVPPFTFPRFFFFLARPLAHLPTLSY